MTQDGQQVGDLETTADLVRQRAYDGLCAIAT